MIIFGTKGKKKVLARGKFHCPHCSARRSYEQIRYGKYFSLYFIPIFPVENLDEYIECATCSIMYDMTVLQQQPTPEEEHRKLVAAIRRQIDAGMPVNTVHQSLLAANFEETRANNLIAEATNGELKICNQCQLVFTRSMNYCGNCGKELTVVAPNS